MTVADEIERLAWQVLRTVNRMQAKDSSVRLVVPRAPEVADELESPPERCRALDGGGISVGRVVRFLAALATRVFKSVDSGEPEVLHKSVSDDFPRDEQGEVNWIIRA